MSTKLLRLRSVPSSGSCTTASDTLKHADIEVIRNNANTELRARDTEAVNLYLRPNSEKAVTGAGDEVDAPRRTYSCVFALGRYVGQSTGSSLLAAQRGAAAGDLTIKEAK